MTPFKAGETYRTRDGREVRIYATDGGGEWPIHGAFRGNDGEWQIERWTAKGCEYEQTNPSAFDLMPPAPKPLKGECWLNVDADGFIVGHRSRAKADVSAWDDRIACIRIDLSQFHEGEGL